MATIDDVARLAGVSTSTVSYAISGKRPISERTRVRVEQAIEELGYRPNAGARALASARSGVIGLAAPLRSGVDVNVIMQFVAGVVTSANDAALDVLLLTQDDDSIARVSGSAMVDGLVVMDVEAEDPRLPELRALPRPVVLIGLPRDPHGLSCVDLDFSQAGQLAARSLLAAGHRSIALIGSPLAVVQRHTSYAERMTRGFVGACEAADAAFLVIPTDASPAGAHQAVDTMLGMLPDVTAVVVHNEVALPHVVSRLRELGRDIPADLSLLAVCPQDVATALPVPASSIDIPAAAIGRGAVEMLRSQLTDPTFAEVRLVSPQLIDRGTIRSPERTQ